LGFRLSSGVFVGLCLGSGLGLDLGFGLGSGLGLDLGFGLGSGVFVGLLGHVSGRDFIEQRPLQFVLGVLVQLEFLGPILRISFNSNKEKQMTKL
jgi:hypothetical protein